MEIKNVSDAAFRKYGRVLTELDLSAFIGALKGTPVPEGVVYKASAPELEEQLVSAELQRVIFGELPIQVGYCNGHNERLNALEYHRSSELNIAATDAILLVGLEKDVTGDFTYDTALVEAFLLPAGSGVELYATTLHYAPCGVGGQGFQVSIVLPKGTNCPLETAHKGTGEDALITAKNKWLIGHPEGKFSDKVHIGLVGKNLNVNE